MLLTEPRTGVLQRRQQVLPDGPGQTRRTWRVSSHRHVHDAGEGPVYSQLSFRTAVSFYLHRMDAVCCHGLNKPVLFTTQSSVNSEITHSVCVFVTEL